MNPAGAESPVELIAEARRALRQVERLMLAPTARDIDFCRAALLEATRRVEQLRNMLASPEASDPTLHCPGLLESAAKLRAQVASIAVLLDHSAAFHAGLLQSMMQASRPENASSTAIRETAPRVLLSA